MRIHRLQHAPFEGLGSIEDWAKEQRHRFTATRLFAGQCLPALATFDWLIVMGGPMSVHDENEHPWLRREKRFLGETIRAGKVVLGVCLGAQLIAAALGARVCRNRYKEIGWFPVELTAAGQGTAIFEGFGAKTVVFHWHGDTFDLPRGAIHVARSRACENQAFMLGDRVVGLQFHLETTPTSVRLMREHLPADLAPGPFAQSAAAILGDERRFRRINGLMRGLLSALEAAQQRRPTQLMPPMRVLKNKKASRDVPAGR